jgi:GTP pyrophosphokinase
MTTAKKASQKPMQARGSYKFMRVCKLHFPEPVVRDIAFAYDLSKYGHHKQRRINDSRYFEHPRAIALILMKELGIYDCDLVISILLHDVPEDSFLLDQHRINRIFGNTVSQIVWLMTKLQSHKGKNVIKYFKRLSESNNWRAILCKCLDRLHNMRTLADAPRDKQLKQFKETREMILPLIDMLEKIIPRVYNYQLVYVKNCLTVLCDHYEKSGEPPKLTKKMIV